MRIVGEYQRQVAVQGDATHMSCTAIKSIGANGDSNWVYLSAEQTVELITELARILAADTGEYNGV